MDVACAADSASSLHVLLVTSGGRLWHTGRAKNGFWTTHSSGTGFSFGDVGKAVGGETGKFKAVAAFTVDTTLHVLAVPTTSTGTRPRVRRSRERRSATTAPGRGSSRSTGWTGPLAAS